MFIILFIIIQICPFKVVSHDFYERVGVSVRQSVYPSYKQVRIHDRISREHWAGALMEVRLGGLNSAVKKTRDGTTDGPVDRPSYRD